MTWANLWTKLKGNWDLPEVNFKENVLFVFTADGPNVPCQKLYDVNGYVQGSVGRTLKGGPGFGYLILQVPNSGLRAFRGKAIE